MTINKNCKFTGTLFNEKKRSVEDSKEAQKLWLLPLELLSVYACLSCVFFSAPCTTNFRSYIQRQCCLCDQTMVVSVLYLIVTFWGQQRSMYYLLKTSHLFWEELVTRQDTHPFRQFELFSQPLECLVALPQM